MLCEICKKRQTLDGGLLTSVRAKKKIMVCGYCALEVVKDNLELCRQEEEKENGTLTNPEKTK